MVPAGVVDKTIAVLALLLEPDDIVIDGGTPMSTISDAPRTWPRNRFSFATSERAEGFGGWNVGTV